jgi:type IV pilus assembly protein PilB
LTGHLVFSTLHTNSSWDAITRLTDMGIEPYLLAASLRLVMAQRLVRVLCQDCKTLSQELLFPTIQKVKEIHTHFVPQGCPNCYYTGYKGRKAVFEVLPINKTIVEMIKERRGDIESYMKKAEISSLSDNLAQLVVKGETSLEEAVMHWES